MIALFLPPLENVLKLSAELGNPANVTQRRPMKVWHSVFLCTLALIFSVNVDAQEIKIDFENIAPPTQVTNQFEPQGVVFGPPGFLPFGVGVRPGLAPSGRVVANIFCGEPVCGFEFASSYATGTFVGSTHKFVKVFVGAFPNVAMTSPQVTLIARDSSGNIVAQSPPVTLTSGAGFHTQLVAESATSNIASFEIREVGDGTGSQIGIDDLSFDTPSGSEPPDFTMSVVPVSADLRQNTSRTFAITLNRLNGSTGSINMAMAGLPAGVTADFSPNPVTTGHSVLSLTADPSAPMTRFPVFAQLSATPSDTTAGTAARSLQILLRVQSNFTVSTPGPATQLVAGCSSVTVPLEIIRDLSFFGVVSLQAQNLATGIHASFAPATIDFHSGAVLERSTLTVTADPGIANTQRALVVVASSPGVPDSRTKIQIKTTRATISSFTPAVGRAPQDLGAGTEVVIRGSGFCAGSTVVFGNQLATATPSSVSADGNEIHVSVPRLATDGPITVILAGGIMVNSTGSFTVQTYRNQKGYSFVNPSVNSVSFDDVTELYGKDQTHLSIDLCWPFGCNVTTPFPSPLAAIYTAIANAALGDGQCSGMALSSQRILHGDKSIGSFFPPGANTVWLLTGPDGGPLPTANSIQQAQKLAHYIHIQHIAQLSSEFTHWWLLNATINVTAPSSHIRAQVVQGLRSGDHPMISIRSGSSGHVLVGYDVEDDGTAAGGFFIYVYDPNIEFQGLENAQATTHRDREGFTDANGVDGGSRIHVTANGHWSFPNFSPAWEGGLDTLVVVPYNIVPVTPTMPISLKGLTTFIFGSNAKTTQITDEAGRRLLTPEGHTNTDPTTALPNATRFAPLEGPSTNSDIYLLGGDGPYTQTVTGVNGGNYSHALFSNFGAIQLETSTSKGSADQISWRQATAGLVFRANDKPKQITARIFTSAEDESQRTFVLRTTSSRTGEIVAFDSSRESVSYEHNGLPTQYSFSVGWAGRQGAPVMFVSPTLKANFGDKVFLEPQSWEHLDNQPVRLLVLHADGTQERQLLTNQTAYGSRIRIEELTATEYGKGRRLLRIRSAVENIPTGSTLFISWNVLKDGASVARQVTVVPAGEIKPGYRFDDWLADFEGGGNFKFIGTVSIITPGDILNSNSVSKEQILYLK